MMARATAVGLSLALALGMPAPASAQIVQGAEDCRIPGTCGTSGTPGGTERVPSEGPRTLDRAPVASDSTVVTAPRAKKKRATKSRSAPAKPAKPAR